jgi:hypothetical protein
MRKIIPFVIAAITFLVGCANLGIQLKPASEVVAIQTAASIAGYELALKMRDKNLVAQIRQGAITLKAAKNDPAFLSTLYPQAVISLLKAVDADPVVRLAVMNIAGMIIVDPKVNLPDSEQVNAAIDGFILGVEMVK